MKRKNSVNAKELLKNIDIRRIYMSGLNIYPTDYCNHNCLFCKLTGVLTTQEGRKDITIEDVDTIIDFCKRSGIKSIRILGGEPSHHPRIVDLIERIYERKLHVGLIFTNGIFDNEELIKCILRHQIPVNMNYFPKDEYGKGELRLVHENMKRLFYGNADFLDKKWNTKDALSITFFRPDQNYQYIIDACLEYGIGYVRWAISEKSLTGENIHVSWMKLREMVPLLVDFVRSLVAEGIHNSIECRLVVPCVLTQKELSFFSKFTDHFMPFKCFPILDVFPDLSVHYCMGMPIVSRITKNNTLNDILLDQMIISEYFRRIPRSEECLKCKWWKEGTCQGYCLQFKYDMDDVRHKILLNGFDWLNNRKSQQVKLNPRNSVYSATQNGKRPTYHKS